MPYMQRITWSGSALHQGPLPGYPASHGCVRLTIDFAQLLWRATKLGARVIVTRPDVAPKEFESPQLSALKPKAAPAPRAPEPQVSEPAATSALVKTADAGNNTPLLAARDDAKPLEPMPAGNTHAEQPTKLWVTDAGAAKAAVRPAEKSAPTSPVVETAKPVALAVPRPIIVEGKPATTPATIVQTIKNKPISVFVSLKESKLYVRQGWQPLFQTPVTIEHPELAIGTHVYTAMGLKADGDLRWTVVSIPSSYKRTVEARSEHGRKGRHERVTKIVEEQAPMPSPSAALDRIVMPPDVIDRIASLMMPGSSLIVSDNKLSDETGESTDFIVLTR